MPQPAFLLRIKERKLVQWALAYAAGAFVVFQLLDALAEPLALTPTIQRSILIIVGIGFFITLVLAWYHGEKGRQRISGPELLMVTLLLVIVGGLLSLVHGREDESASADGSYPYSVSDDRVSIAVLPLESTDSDPEAQSFTNGVHEEILTRLSRIEALRVIARTSVEAYRESPPPIRQIGAELDVGYVVEGSVQKMADRVRINVQLIDAPSEAHIWAETFDRELTPEAFFEVQGEIARTIAGELRVSLTREESARLRESMTDNLEAYRLYRQAMSVPTGMYELEPRLRRIRLLQEAVALDPEFLAAWWRLAYQHAFVFQQFDGSSERVDHARNAVEQARRIDPDNPLVHFAEAWVLYRVDRDYDGAVFSLQRIGPVLWGDADFLSLKALAERRAGQWNASIESHREAITLSPLASAYSRDLAVTYRALRRYDEAAQVIRASLEVNANSTSGAYYRAWIQLLQDGAPDALLEFFSGVTDPRYAFYHRWLGHFLAEDWDGAREAVVASGPSVHEDVNRLIPKPLFDAWTEAARGNGDEAASLFRVAANDLEALVDDRPADSRIHRSLAFAYAGLGLQERAVEQAEKALDFLPPERDAMTGPWNIWGLGLTYAQLGDAESAIEYLDRLLSTPGPESVKTLAIDPRLDRIREHPAFLALMEKHADDVEH